jgi:hypothetical protein
MWPPGPHPPPGAADEQPHLWPGGAGSQQEGGWVLFVSTHQATAGVTSSACLVLPGVIGSCWAALLVGRATSQGAHSIAPLWTDASNDWCSSVPISHVLHTQCLVVSIARPESE